MKWPPGIVLGPALVMAGSLAVALAFQAAGWGVPSQVLALSVGVVGVAARSGLRAGAGAAAAAVLWFNFFFTSPLYSLLVDDARNYLVFVLLLVLGVVVGSLTDQLQARTRQAQSALLLQGLSHDWRTPLAVIAGTAATLGSTAEPRLEPNELGRLALIEREARDLSRQMETILALVELENKAARRLLWVPAEELVHSARERFTEWHPERKVSLDFGPGLPLVKVEPTLIERALINLLDNADRASPAEVAIDLVVAASPRTVEFQVYDRGPGVPTEVKPRLFQPFAKDESAGASRRGTGLGLALVRQAARLHGGDAGVRDRAGGGSVFWVRLPVPDGAPGSQVPE